MRNFSENFINSPSNYFRFTFGVRVFVGVYVRLHFRMFV